MSSFTSSLCAHFIRIIDLSTRFFISFVLEAFILKPTVALFIVEFSLAGWSGWTIGLCHLWTSYVSKLWMPYWAYCVICCISRNPMNGSTNFEKANIVPSALSPSAFAFILFGTKKWRNSWESLSNISSEKLMIVVDIFLAAIVLYI